MADKTDRNSVSSVSSLSRRQQALSLLQTAKDRAKRAQEDGLKSLTKVKQEAKTLALSAAEMAGVAPARPDNRLSSGSANGPMPSYARPAAQVPMGIPLNTPQKSAPSARSADQRKVDRLCDLGFSAASARHALMRCGGRLDEAGLWLLEETHADEIMAAEFQASLDSPLHEGCTAKISGLRGAGELNGLYVTLLALDAESQRWACRVPDGSFKAIRPRNLELIATAPKPKQGDVAASLSPTFSSPSAQGGSAGSTSLPKPQVPASSEAPAHSQAFAKSPTPAKSPALKSPAKSSPAKSPSVASEQQTPQRVVELRRWLRALLGADVGEFQATLDLLSEEELEDAIACLVEGGPSRAAAVGAVASEDTEAAPREVAASSNAAGAAASRATAAATASAGAAGVSDCGGIAPRTPPKPPRAAPKHAEGDGGSSAIATAKAGDTVAWDLWAKAKAEAVAEAERVWKEKEARLEALEQETRRRGDELAAREAELRRKEEERKEKAIDAARAAQIAAEQQETLRRRAEELEAREAELRRREEAHEAAKAARKVAEQEDSDDVARYRFASKSSLGSYSLEVERAELEALQEKARATAEEMQRLQALTRKAAEDRELRMLEEEVRHFREHSALDNEKALIERERRRLQSLQRSLLASPQSALSCLEVTFEDQGEGEDAEDKVPSLSSSSAGGGDAEVWDLDWGAVCTSAIAEKSSCPSSPFSPVHCALENDEEPHDAEAVPRMLFEPLRRHCGQEAAAEAQTS